ncbi:Hypothetical protein SMAX5B_005679 [Scophthalmus maximus]|uniref:Uncharacterized protein n=1 Tax=Scophthalmus maximus TaxID=52904 RepID=A0A2U9BBP9_SCOMX|nr:Hypothetical protein SMAX5B_005679 [Scophthalmus maximus]
MNSAGHRRSKRPGSRNSRHGACGVSDVDGDQLPEPQPWLPLVPQQLCLLRPRIPAGQAHFTLITCADLRPEDELARGAAPLLRKGMLMGND